MLLSKSNKEPKIIEPETTRLKLRQWLPSDIAPFAAMSADPDVMTFFPSTLTYAESEALANKCRAHIAKTGWGAWAIELKETKAFIGVAGLNVPSKNLPCCPCVEVLWRLAPADWGKGYATEAANACLKTGFEQLKLDEIVAFAVANNFRSRAVMKRLNMRDTQNTFEHPELPADSPLRKHCLYKITQQQWHDKKEQFR